MAKTEDVRAVNLKKIKEVFLAEGICTKNMLAKKTGLSLGTCTNLLKYLIEHQMIRRIEDSASTGGRKAKRYQLIDNAVYYGLVYYDQKQFYVEKIDIRGKTIESKITVNASWVDSWCKQDFKKILFCGMDKEVYANATFYQRPVLVASYGYSQENHLDNVAFIYQASQELSHCGLVLNGRMFEGYSNFAGEMSYIPIENQENQMKMLKSKKKRQV